MDAADWGVLTAIVTASNGVVALLVTAWQRRKERQQGASEAATALAAREAERAHDLQQERAREEKRLLEDLRNALENVRVVAGEIPPAGTLETARERERALRELRRWCGAASLCAERVRDPIRVHAIRATHHCEKPDGPLADCEAEIREALRLAGERLRQLDGLEDDAL